MNIFKKIYCRVFQFIMRVAIPFLPYRKPVVLNNVEDIGDTLILKKINKVLIVTDKGIISNGLCDALTSSLNEKNIEYVIYDETVPNPTISNIEEARKIYVENNLSAIIAIGGGSPIDLAKIVGARIVKPKQSVSKMKGLLKINKKIPLLIAIPTTAGTGSEVTIAAVITDDKTHHKYPINDFCLIPSYAVLDYKNTLKLPRGLTASTGMDALTHAIEAYIGNSLTKETKEYALLAVKMIVKNIYNAYENPGDKTSRESMLLASHYAGIAFTKSYVGYVHSIAHALGGKYGLSHGLTNAIILPHILEAYGDKITKKLAFLGRYCEITNSENDNEASRAFINFIKNINKKMNIPEYIDGIINEDLDELALHADKEANPLYPVPVLFDKDELKNIIKKLANIS